MQNLETEKEQNRNYSKLAQIVFFETTSVYEKLII